MNTKDDMIAALRHQRPKHAVPIWELEFQAWDAASGKHVVLGHEFEALDAAGQEKALRFNAEIMVAVSMEMEFAAITVPGSYWNHSPGQLAYYCLPGDAPIRQAAVLRELAPPDLMLIANTGGIMGADYSPEFCFKLLEDPDGIDEMVRHCLDRGIEKAMRFKDCGIEAIFSASDIADNSGPFFSPDQMDRWILPYLTKWSDAIRNMGMYSILHTDGNVTQYIDAIASSGVDAIQAIDPVAGMDMRKTQEIVGNRLCLCGNVDCGILLTGQPDDVYQATKSLLTTCKDQGNLVLGASNAVQPEVPINNYRAMVRAWKEFGQYGEI